MRITVRFRDDLLTRAKKHAAESHRTLTAIVEEGVALVLAKSANKRRGGIHVPVSRASGGVLPGCDLTRSSDIEESMDDA